MSRSIKLLLLFPLVSCTLLIKGVLGKCGDGFLQEDKDEQCDDGNNADGDGCDSFCRFEAVCGDNLVDPPEQCDDGNLVGNDGCDPTCATEECGNLLLQALEECDDGNNLNGDGCSALCVIESCGDGVVNNNATESCDDGNVASGDGCDNNCQIEIPIGCGDGSINVPEECDEGPNNSQAPNAICRINCQLAGCGDAILDDLFGEECDDGNNISGDGCSVICLTEDFCGDNVLGITEACDDGNTNNNDGCDADCNLSAVIQISAGGAHTCALFRSGDVRCWGEADNGRLGYGNLNDIGDNELARAAGNVNLGQSVVQIATGSAHTCVLLFDGDIRCWGANDSGQLGQGNNLTDDIGDNEAPNSIAPISFPNPVLQLTAGDNHTCARTNLGEVFCWGAGSGGVLGYGNSNNIGDNETPASVGPVAVGGTVAQIAAGASHTCALRSDQGLLCWGLNNSGQLGYGNSNNIGDNETPNTAGALNIDAGVSSVSAGGAFTCAIFNAGGLKCWGINNFGQLGQGDTVTFGDNATELPASLALIDFAVNDSARQLDAGGDHVCAVFTSGSVRCWGRGNLGQLGYASSLNRGDAAIPGADTVELGQNILSVSAGNFHSCALFQSGVVHCWGNGANGRLGYGNLSNIGDTETPASVGEVPVF